MKLRDYQTESVAAVASALEVDSSTLLVLPTGTGKTVCFAELGKHWGGRVLAICPALSIMDQTVRKFEEVTGQEVAIEQAENMSAQFGWDRANFIVASKQSLMTTRKVNDERRYTRFKDISLVIVDEAHLGVNNRAKEMLSWFIGNGAKVLGCTATPKRHDKKALGQLFETCAYKMGILRAMSEGWLVPARVSCIQLESLDLTNVRTSAGEFIQGGEGGLNELLEDDKTVLEIASITAQESGTLKTAVYCGSVAEARKVAGVLRDRFKINADWICGEPAKCSKHRRREILNSFTSNELGTIQVVCNVDVLSTGWDFPGLEHIVMARPTKSRPRYEQIFGRGLRTLPGVVDFPDSDAGSRVEAIANSGKPHIKFTDLRDNSLKHRLVNPMDVLGGTYSLETQDKAYELSQGKQGFDPLDMLQTSEDVLVATERRRLKKVKADAIYSKQNVNVTHSYAGSVLPEQKSRPKTARMVFGMHKGKPISQLPIGYINYALKNWSLKTWLRNAMVAEQKYRAMLKKA